VGAFEPTGQPGCSLAACRQARLTHASLRWFAAAVAVAVSSAMWWNPPYFAVLDKTDVRTVQHWMGHKSLETTMRYLAVARDINFTSQFPRQTHALVTIITINPNGPRSLAPGARSTILRYTARCPEA
jgi:hypothetical protein